MIERMGGDTQISVPGLISAASSRAPTCTREKEAGGSASRLGDGAVRKGPNAAGRGRTLTKVVLSMDEGVDHKAVEQLPQKKRVMGLPLSVFLSSNLEGLPFNTLTLSVWVPML